MWSESQFLIIFVRVLTDHPNEITPGKQLIIGRSYKKITKLPGKNTPYVYIKRVYVYIL